MGYVIAAVLVLLIVAAGVTVFVLRATRSQRRSAAADSDYGGGTPGSDAAIVSPDEGTPLGDTDQHSGEQTREGRTVGDTESAESTSGSGSPPAGGQGALGGEAEGGRRTPASERMANRPR